MLELLRAISKTWYAKILLGILVLSFGAFGISNVVTDLGSNTIARVGDEDITAKQFQRAYQQELNRVSQQIGRVPTPQEAQAMGVPDQVIANLSVNAAINHVTKEFGLGASEAQLAKMLREDPTFRGTLGNFDKNTFLALLQQSGYTQAEYFDLEAQAARRQQLVQALFADAAVPETAQQIVARYTGDKRTIDYFVVNDTAIGDIAAPTDTELADYLKAHQADFRTEETRSIDLLSFSPEVIASTKTVPEAQIRAEYEKQKPALTKVESRHVEQVVLPSDADAKAFADAQAAGKSFADTASELKLDVIDLGTMSKEQISDSQLADTAFSLPLNGIAIIPGIGGQRAVTVTEIHPGGTESFEQAKAMIADQLALAEAKSEYADELDQIEALRAAFKPLPEIAKRFNLPVHHVDLTRSGDALDPVTSIAPDDRQKVIDAVFKAEPKKLSPMITLAGNHNVWFDLQEVAPARDRTLAEVHDQVVAAWTADATAKAVEAKVKALTADLDSGKSFEDVAAEINTVPQLSEPITRSGNGTSVLTANVAEAAFQGAEGHTGSAKDGDGDYVLFKVDQVTPSTAKLPDQTRTFLANSIRNNLVSEYVTGIRSEQGLRINQGALNQLLALNVGP
jgi:peptidyl-prolyl cis-trans isomerase D